MIPKFKLQGQGLRHGSGVAPERRGNDHFGPPAADPRVPKEEGTADVVQHAGRNARQGDQLRHDGRRVGDPRGCREEVRRDHRGREHPIQVGEGRHSVSG